MKHPEDDIQRACIMWLEMMREPSLYKIDVATGHENALWVVYHNKEVQLRSA